MNCENVKPLLDPLADNELPTETIAQVMEHISVCLACEDVWRSRVNLRERFRAFTANLQVPYGALERLDQKIEEEISLPKRTFWNPRHRLFIGAAAALALLLGVFAMILTATKPLVTPQQLAYDFSGSGVVRHDQGIDSQYMEIDEVQLKKISNYVGFEVKPPSIGGWNLVSADVYNDPDRELCLARFIYETSAKGKKNRVMLYQGCEGRFEPNGLEERVMAGRQICCGKVGELAVAYWLGQGMDHILVGSMSEKELMMVALKA